GRGGAVVAGAEEPDGELGLGLRRRVAYVAGPDRRGDRDVPGDLAVGLHEVRVAVGEGVELVERLGFVADLLRAGRHGPGAVRHLARETVDGAVAEQPLGV